MINTFIESRLIEKRGEIKTVIEYNTIFSVCIGGLLTLLGTLLANFLQYRSEERKRKIERKKERFAEIRRYLAVCLEFADLTTIPATMGEERFDHNAFDEWEDLINKHQKKWESLPVHGSGRVLYVDDKKIIDWLSKIDQLKIFFYAHYYVMIKDREIVSPKEKLDELKDLTQKVSNRLDVLLSN